MTNTEMAKKVVYSHKITAKRNILVCLQAKYTILEPTSHSFENKWINNETKS